VVSSIVGLTGTLIITAILDGERDPARLAALRDERCKNDEAVIAQALEGTWRDEHLFELRQAYELYRTYQMKVTECDAQIEQATKGAIHISLVPESGWPHPILGTGEWVDPSNREWVATSNLVASVVPPD